MINANHIAVAEQLVEARSRVASLVELLDRDELQQLEALARQLARGRMHDTNALHARGDR